MGNYDFELAAKLTFQAVRGNHFLQIEEPTKTPYLPTLKHWRDPEKDTLSPAMTYPWCSGKYYVITAAELAPIPLFAVLDEPARQRLAQKAAHIRVETVIGSYAKARTLDFLSFSRAYCSY
ncbi:hypothetical protein RBB77_21410 [Tunturibacter psychrotolerans]|uniref:Uncharacterized protein n=1 Tax=Tunturiibacter psychrotolerans TaxID=3069686 RepID=A0AAU7ZPT1_9BACT